MDSFTQKTLKTTRGYTYTYYVFPGDKTLPTLLLQHGWPDHALMWKDVAERLRSTQHPIIIPDMMGYHGTSKPTDPAIYKWDGLTRDMIDILDAEDAEKCVSIGHDWGSGAASSLYNYFPDRVVGLVNMNVPYQPPQRTPFSLDAINAIAEKIFGYQSLAYWHLFIASDAPSILRNNVERLFTAMHSAGSETLKSLFCTQDALRDYLTGKTNPTISLRPYAQDPGFKQAFLARMSRDGFEGPQCWYKAKVSNLQMECDAKLPEDRDTVKVPALYIGCTEDAVCRPESMYESIQMGLLPDLEQADMIEAGHWVTYEKPLELAKRLDDWLKRRVGS